MTKRHVWKILAVAAIVAAVGYFSFEDRDHVDYRLAPVERGSIVTTVAAAGSVRAPVTVSVLSNVSGQVVDLPGQFNQVVHKGDVLAQVRADEVAARLAMVQSDLVVAKSAMTIATAQLDQTRIRVRTARADVTGKQAATQSLAQSRASAEHELELKQQMLASGDIARVDARRADSSLRIATADLEGARAREVASSSEYDAAQVAVRVAEAQLDSAEATVASKEALVRQVQYELDQTTIRSPIDGFVADRLIVIGDTVHPGTPLFTIVSPLGNLNVFANVDEADIGRVVVGQKAVFTFDAYPGQTFSGIVADIRKLPINNQGVVTYSVVIDADNSALKLLPGMTAGVSILVAQHDNVLKVPRAALRFTPPGADNVPNGDHVWKLNHSGDLVAVPVKVGISDPATSEVVEGEVKQGDQLIVGITTPQNAKKRSLFKF